jgi:hypothetical protein
MTAPINGDPNLSLREIADILWPLDDPDAEWSVDELDAVAEVLARAGLRPPERPPTCDICGDPDEYVLGGTNEADWNGETGNHASCEQGIPFRAKVSAEAARARIFRGVSL